MKHYNQSLAFELAKILNIKGDNVSSDIEDYIQPVIEVNPRLNKVGFAFVGTSTNATSSTIFTTSSSNDTYITAMILSVIKDVTSQSSVTNISVTINGASVIICSIPSITLTVQNQSVSIQLTNPIKIDKGTNVQVINGNGTANITAKACVYGFVDEIN
jgi:hypothetical protein